MKVGSRMTEQQKPQKEYYSLRELVTEITGVTELNPHASFGGEYKAIERIVLVMNKLVNKKKEKIASDDKDAFVIITKHLYEMIYNDNSGEGQKLFKRLKLGNELTHSEYSRLIAFFIEGLSANPNHPDFQHFNQLIKRAESDDRFLEIQNEVEKRIIDDFKLMEELDSFEVREQRANEYIAFLTKAKEMNTWRNEVKQEINQERIMKRVVSIATSKGFDMEEVVAGTNATILEEITKEMVNQDIQSWINHKKETEA